MNYQIDEEISKAIHAAIMDMSFSEVRELTTSAYMEIRTKMQNDSKAEGEV